MKKIAPFLLVAGILLLISYIVLWTIYPYLYGISLGFPLFLLSYIFLNIWYWNRRNNSPSKKQQLNFGLQLLLINYTIIYVLIIIGNFIPIEKYIGNLMQNIDLFSNPEYILIILFLIYTIGFLYSWKNRLVAGTALVVWYIGVTWARNNIGSTDLKFYGYTAILVLIIGILFIGMHLWICYKKLND